MSQTNTSAENAKMETDFYSEMKEAFQKGLHISKEDPDNTGAIYMAWSIEKGDVCFGINAGKSEAVAVIKRVMEEDDFFAEVVIEASKDYMLEKILDR